jgi:hypothetical protein
LTIFSPPLPSSTVGNGASSDNYADGGDKPNPCGDEKKSLNEMAMASALGVVNIGGIFVVLLCGLAFAVVVAVAEFCWARNERCVAANLSIRP